MKLYQIEKESKVYYNLSDGSDYFIFHYIDGEYSSCTTEEGNMFQISANTELEEYKDGYKIINK